MTRLLQSLLLLFVALQVVVVVGAEEIDHADTAGSSGALEELQRELDMTRSRLTESEQRLQELGEAKSTMEQSLQGELAALKLSAEASAATCKDDLRSWESRLESLQHDLKEQEKQAVQKATSEAAELVKQMEVKLAQQAEDAERRIQTLTDEKSTMAKEAEDAERRIQTLKDEKSTMLAKQAKDLEKQVNAAKDKTLKVRQELLAASEKIRDLEEKAKESFYTKSYRGLKETKETRPIVDLLEESFVWFRNDVWTPSVAAMHAGWVALEPTRKQVSAGLDEVAEVLKPVTESGPVQAVLAYRRLLLEEAESWVQNSSKTVDSYCQLEEKTKNGPEKSFLMPKLCQSSRYAKKNSQSIVKWTERGLYILQVYALMVIMIYAFSSANNTSPSKKSEDHVEEINGGSNASPTNKHKKNHKHGGKGGNSPNGKAKRH